MIPTTETLSQDTTTDIATPVHLFCADCYPTPELGDSIQALCGEIRHYLGETTEGQDCRYCVALTRFPCQRCD